MQAQCWGVPVQKSKLTYSAKPLEISVGLSEEISDLPETGFDRRLALTED